MPRKANEIAVEWLESKDAGKRNRVNVKHIIGKLQEVAVGGKVVVSLACDAIGRRWSTCSTGSPNRDRSE